MLLTGFVNTISAQQTLMQNAADFRFPPEIAKPPLVLSALSRHCDKTHRLPASCHSKLDKLIALNERSAGKV